MGAQKLVAGHYERDFDLIFRFKADQNLVANLQNTVNVIFTWFFTLRRLKTRLQSIMEEDGPYSYDNEQK